MKEDFSQIISSDLDWKEFENKTILITGANGFLPAYMVEVLLFLNQIKLQDKPCRIIALVRNKKHAQQRFYKYLNNDKFFLLVQDVAEPIQLIEKIDYIIHAASPASPKYYKKDPLGVIMPNVFGTKNTLDLAVANNVDGYLYFSSGEVYGKLLHGEVMREDNYGFLDSMELRNCYGESKRMGEIMCVSYAHQYNLPIKIVRPFHTYGPGMKLDDGRVFADFVKNIINNENIQLTSDGSAERSFCYLADAVIGFFTVLLKGKVKEAYNIANPNQTISIKNLALLLVTLFPEKKLSTTFIEQKDDYLQSPIFSPVADITKISALNWKPTTTIHDGFKKTIRSFLDKE